MKGATYIKDIEERKAQNDYVILLAVLLTASLSLVGFIG